MDIVDAAIAAVPERHFVLTADGARLPQSSNPAIIAAMLRLAAIPRGARPSGGAIHLPSPFITPAAQEIQKL